jgi:AraC-like DNA-binding protein
LSSRDEGFAIGDSSPRVGEQRFVRSALLNAYAEAARSLGLDPFRMLRKARLPVSALDHPDQLIPYDRLQILVDSSSQAASCPEFGLLVGAAFKLSMMGPLGLLAREQATLRDAINALQRYVRYQNNSIEIRTALHDGALLFMPVVLSARARRDPQMVDLTIAMYVQVMRDLIGANWRPEMVYFSHETPADLSPYESKLGKVEFSRPVSGFFIAAKDLDRSVADGDSAFAAEIARLIERTASPQTKTVSERVSDLIVTLLPEGHCTVDSVAEHLGVDRRTIHRRLAAEGCSFTELREAARREVATEHLINGDQSLSEVTHLVGFSSLSTFSRWFRHTYGVQPSEFRRQAHDDD